MMMSGCGSATPVPAPPITSSATSTTITLPSGEATSTGNIVENGYRVAYVAGATPQTPGTITFTSPNGKQIILPKEIEKFLNDQATNRHVTSFDLPVDPHTPSLVYLSTSAPLTKDFSAMENHIYRFSLLTQELTEIYGEKTTNSTLVRTIGRDGSLLILLRNSINYSPGVCAALWFDFREQLLAFDLEHPERGLLRYTPPTNKVAEALREEQTCLKNIQ
jgi:hypothetical protein